MSRLPVIIGFGGISPAGRSSFHHAYRRMVVDDIDKHAAEESYLDLAVLSGLVKYNNGTYIDSNDNPLSASDVAATFCKQLQQNTLIRRIDPSLFDANRMLQHKIAELTPGDSDSIKFTIKHKHLPQHLPSNWHIDSKDNDLLEITIPENLEILFRDEKPLLVQSAGQLPTGFNPAKLYQSRNHPRALQMTVFGASDALRSSGIDWETIANSVAPDQIAVYAGGSLAQLDDAGLGGMLKAGPLGKRVSSKQLALGYGQMPADFINAYILGSVGSTGASLGACASYLYNLQAGMRDIQSGKRRVVLVGASDAAVTPELIEGFRTIGALAEDAELLALDADKGLTGVDHFRACRPFADNCGFTIAESSQFTLLVDDDLAIELGAQIHGAVADVFVNADGFKKSITAPGIGNYITMGKAAATIRSILGDDSLQKRSFVHAHGTGTPQNRTTESHVLNETAKAFGINDWNIAAVKCYLGHSQGTAAGDQMMAALGTWQYGLIPGISTLDQVAHDVYTSNLNLSQQAVDVGSTGMDSVILNSKGFGGNNASAAVLAPHIVENMLSKKHGKDAMKAYQKKREAVSEQAEAYNQSALRGESKPIYKFGHNVLTGYELEISKDEIKIPGYKESVSLDIKNKYDDMF